jgi:hypothetical protein
MRNKTDQKATVRATNAAFAKMTAAEKRVQIAKDVIAQLDAGKLRAKRMRWVAEPIIGAPDEEVRDALGDSTCHACALGAAFVCAVRRADKLTIRDAFGWDPLVDGEGNAHLSVGGQLVFDYLKRFFSVDQLSMIETAFEGGKGEAEHSDEAARWASGIRSAETRMRLVMKNIIANKGAFKLKTVPKRRGLGWALEDAQ